MQIFVDKLRWCTYVVFTELLMLGQCMPGPTSTQMGFAIGVLKKGLAGGLLSGVLFQGPGFLMLSVLGWAAARLLSKDIHWLNGLIAGLAAAGDPGRGVGPAASCPRLGLRRVTACSHVSGITATFAA